VSRDSHQGTAIVLGHVDFGERDRIVRLLSPEHGRVSGLARGVRSSRRRFGGALDTGNRVQVLLRPGKGELWHIQEATLESGREGARHDLLRLTLLAYACELCGGLAREHEPEPRLFGLLDTALVLLDAMTGAPGAAFRLGLEAKALTFAGLGPSLTRCVACGELLVLHEGPEPAPGGEGEEGPEEGPEELALDPLRGGAVHHRCGPGLPPVDPAWLRAVEAARRAPLRELVDTPLPVGPEWFLADMVQVQLGRALQARRVLAPLLAPPLAPPLAPAPTADGTG